MRKNAVVRTIIVACLTFSLAHMASAATLTISSGKLTGATAVSVNGSLYDVAFVEGTCAGLFNGCQSNADLIFQSQADAQSAGQAILDQIYHDPSAGTFDSDYTLMYGCSSNSLFGVGVCGAAIPYFNNGSFFTADAWNFSSNSGFADSVGSGGVSLSTDTTFLSYVVYAVFTSSSAAPEPATWATMLLGFAGIGLAVRRRNLTAHQLA